MRSHDDNAPSKFWLKFFRWFCRAEYKEDIEGDLLERFDHRVEKQGAKVAKKLFVKDVLRLFRPSMIGKSKGKQQLNYYSMFKHNLTINLRNFRRHKSSFLINLIGLTSGLTCVLLIYLWVNDELSVDKFHENKSELYHVMSNHSDASGISTLKGVPGLLLEEIVTSVPEVTASTAYTDAHEYTLSVDDLSLKTEGLFASAHFTDVFTYPMIEGDGAKALSDNSSILITKSLAEKLFPNEDPMGKIIKWHFWSTDKDFIIRGILKDIPKNSSQQFEFLLPWNYFHDELITYKNWGNYYGRISLLINDNQNKDAATAKIDGIYKSNAKQQNVDLFLTNYADQYLYGKYENGELAGGRIEYVRLFSIIALFILFIACINFINLSTAKASHRTKEIGVKKSMGATRGSLALQYLMESVLISLIALILSFLVVLLILPQFNFITQKQLSLIFDWDLIKAAFSIILVVGLAAGSYPALYLSKLNALEILKGKRSPKEGKALGRKALVIIQFSISTILIVGVLVILKQMDFVKNQNLGYDRENIVYFEREGQILSQYEAFIEELRNIPGVDKAAVSGFMVGGMNSTGGISWEGKTPEDQIQFSEFNAGNNMLSLLGIQLLEGRDFSEQFSSNAEGVIFNETAIKAMGLKDPIGKTIEHYTGPRQIIGVVKDFNIRSMHSQIEPALFLYKPSETHFIMAKIKKGTESATLQKIESLYEKFNPEFPFKAQFVDQDYQALYVSEERVAELSKYFAGLAIVISCLGLFGLAAFTTENRMKEISIRKVLGSSIWSIVKLLTGQFSLLVLLAIVIGLPISYYVSSSWLNDFAYQIELSWWYFAAAGILAFVISWLTISLQTFKAARINPAQSLRSE
jgi:putative ABC transport system permease protein